MDDCPAPGRHSWGTILARSLKFEDLSLHQISPLHDLGLMVLLAQTDFLVFPTETITSTARGGQWIFLRDRLFCTQFKTLVVPLATVWLHSRTTHESLAV